jgi:hypothetical protein
MRWFRKRKQNDIWDNALEQPIGDLEAAHSIRKICEAAADIATTMNSHPGSAAERERYERATKTAMQIAIKISDDLIRDAALRQIIDLCVKANYLRRAEVLLRAIQATSIRETVLNDNPTLRN